LYRRDEQVDHRLQIIKANILQVANQRCSIRGVAVSKREQATARGKQLVATQIAKIDRNK
jgi:hypothetical protein